MTKKQKAKFFSLLARDMCSTKSDNSKGQKGTEDNKHLNGKICEFHEPLKVFQFLHKFTMNETTLKYTTHFWDKNSKTGKYAYDNFESFKDLYLNDLEEGDPKFSEIYNLCRHLWEIIKNFLVRDDSAFTWSEHKIKIGYNKYVKEWMDANPGLQPASMPLTAFPKNLQPTGLINGKVLSYFSDIIEIFKRCIEFRDNDLYISVLKIFKNSDHIIDENKLNDLLGRAIYTDTEQIKEALRIIAGNIFQRPMYPNLKISCVPDSHGTNKVIQFKILQVDSFSNRDINDARMRASSKEGDLYRIKEKLRNLCDFSVESNFRIGNEIKHRRINYLSSDENCKDYEDIDDIKCEGFTYVLTFYTV